MAIPKEFKAVYKDAIRAIGDGPSGCYKLEELLTAQRRMYADGLIAVTVCPWIISILEEFLNPPKEESGA